jgi:type IV pilus assembly protein PilC
MALNLQLDDAPRSGAAAREAREALQARNEQHWNLHARAEAGPAARVSDYKLNGRELEWLTAQLALMLETGTTIVDAVHALAEQTQNATLEQMLNEIEGSLANGASFPEALSYHPETFSRYYLASVRAGDSVGELPQVFRRLEDTLQRRRSLMHNIKSAITYPSIITGLAVVAVVFIIAFVLPKFAKLYAQQSVALPLPTRLLLGISGIVQSHWPLLLLALAGTVAGMVYLLRAGRFKPARDAFWLRVPFIGDCIREFELSRMTRVTGMLLQSGIPLVEALEVASHTASNHIYATTLRRMVRNLMQGESFASCIAGAGIIPPSIRQMICTGERSGALTRVMFKIADHLDDNSEKKLKRVSVILEPLIIIVLGVVIGFIALSLLLPLFKLTSVVKGGL